MRLPSVGLSSARMWLRVLLVCVVVHSVLNSVVSSLSVLPSPSSVDDADASVHSLLDDDGTGGSAGIPYYSGWTYILALGIIVAFADGFGPPYSLQHIHSHSHQFHRIGANDVANSFATSVGSGSLTLFQAVCIGLFTESCGALLLGKNTSETIRGKIVNVALYANNPAVLSLGMFCALIGSSTFVLLATSRGLPVSTTHCIVGAIMGVGIATFGVNGVDWGFSGFGGIVAAWFISPAMGGVLAISIWKFTENMVLKQNNSFEVALRYIPGYFFVTSLFIVFFLLYKGISRIDISQEIGLGGTIGVAIGVATVAAILSWFYYVPFIRRHADTLYARQRQQQQQQGEVIGEGGTEMQQGGGDFVRLQDHSDDNKRSSGKEQLLPEGSQSTDWMDSNSQTGAAVSAHANGQSSNKNKSSSSSHEDDSIAGWEEMSLFERGKALLLRGVRVDVVHHAELADMHARVPKYDNKTEIIYSTLQILTAAFASFAHGSNDIANAVGPLSTIWSVYNSDYQQGVSSSTETPIWVVFICTIGLDLGLFTYGYHIMRELGNKITYHSPARGFSMELAAGFAVLIASKLGWPISTTHCITGATLAVGLSTGDINAVNWRRSIIYMLAWMVTVPFAGLVAGIIFSLMAYAPKAYVCPPYQTTCLVI